ncbi:MAG: GntR family transcriptional regulator [Egibacteraceae bacterium]
MSITSSPGGPTKYRQLADHLRREIEDGRYRPGEALPTETQLVGQFRVSRNTVRQAVALLRSAGLVNVEHGRGAFVRNHPRLRRVSRNRYAESRQTGRTLTGLTSQITRIDTEPAPADIALLLGVDEGEPVFARSRTVFDDAGNPVELSTSYFLLSLAQGTDLTEPRPIPGGLFQYVEQLTGRRYTRAQEYITTRPPTPQEAQALQIEPTIPVLRLLHAAYDADGQSLEVVDSIFPADRHELYDEFDLN